MHIWSSPIKAKLVQTSESLSFKEFDMTQQTGLPLAPHPGAFGVVRKNHVHEGIDLYVPEGTEIFAVEPGLVVGVVPFTGEHAGSPWWENTWAVLVEGPSGVVLYGEILSSVKEGDILESGSKVGSVVRVLKVDKGRPQSMLHLELHKAGNRLVKEWSVTGEKPDFLKDPTPYLMHLTK